MPRKRGKVKGKGEWERYTHTQLNAEFHKIARRDKKAFLNEQYEEIEDNDRIGKTRRQSGCLRRLYKQLRKEENGKASKKEKDIFN